MVDYSTATMAELIEARKAVNVRIKQANELLKAAKDEQDMIDGYLMKAMDGMGTSRMATKEYSVSISESVVPEVTDWEMLYEHVIATRDFSLIQRRVSSTAYREILDQGQAVPGLTPRTKRDINFRSL